GYKKLAKKNNLGSSFKKIALPEGDQRGGLMTQGAFLNMTTDGESTSPILRGVWILKNIYGAHLEPPAGIPTIEPDIRNTKTLKEIMAAHQAQSSCSRCHSKIDPLGVPFEHFDVVGKLRDKYAKVEVSYTKDEATKVFGKKSGPYVKLGYSPIDSKIKMASGVEVETPTEIKREMLKDMEVISKAFIKKLLSYGLGRDIIYSEQTHVDDIYKNSLAKGLGMKDIIRECVKSTIFKQH
ncbi:MAG: DUF1588 domain-containing protein, partial [Lentisphaeraceae bacterium]|nr:DUF1588 domain-containing protein [Lentisphaeraceae bacterium]